MGSGASPSVPFRDECCKKRKPKQFLLGRAASVDGKNPELPISPGNPLDHRVPARTTLPALELERLAQERKLGNVRVVRGSKQTTLNHTDMPRTHFANLLKAARYLDGR